MATKAEYLSYMQEHAGEHMSCGEVDCTKLAEDAADFFDETDRLDDNDDEIWLYAFEAADWYERQVRMRRQREGARDD